MNDMPMQSRAMSRVLKAVSNPDRIRIVMTLADQSMNVSSLCQRLAMRGPRMSQHLSDLRRLGLVWFESRGREQIYHLRDRELANWIAEASRFIETEPQHIESDTITRARDIRSFSAP